MFLDLGEQTGSGVLNVLEFMECFGWQTVEEAIEVFESGE